MGKRTSNLTGLSRYVLDAFKESPLDSRPTQSEQEKRTTTTITYPDRQHHGKERPAKRRKTTIKPERSKYDASGMVPHYRKALDVPDHLQKCPSLLSYILHIFINHRWHAHRFLPEKTIFLVV